MVLMFFSVVKRANQPAHGATWFARSAKDAEKTWIDSVINGPTAHINNLLSQLVHLTTRSGGRNVQTVSGRGCRCFLDGSVVRERHFGSFCVHRAWCLSHLGLQLILQRSDTNECSSATCNLGPGRCKLTVLDIGHHLADEVS